MSSTLAINRHYWDDKHYCSDSTKTIIPCSRNKGKVLFVDCFTHGGIKVAKMLYKITISIYQSISTSFSSVMFPGTE